KLDKHAELFSAYRSFEIARVPVRFDHGDRNASSWVGRVRDRIAPPLGHLTRSIYCYERPAAYCLSKTATFLNFFPLAVVPLTSDVRLLPSADTAVRGLTAALPPFFTVTSSVRSSSFL